MPPGHCLGALKMLQQKCTFSSQEINKPFRPGSEFFSVWQITCRHQACYSSYLSLISDFFALKKLVTTRAEKFIRAYSISTHVDRPLYSIKCSYFFQGPNIMPETFKPADSSSKYIRIWQNQGMNLEGQRKRNFNHLTPEDITHKLVKTK